MPFKSASQRKFLFAKKPAVAKEFASKEKGKKMPMKKGYRMSGDGMMKS